MDLTPRGCSSIGGELALSMERTRNIAMSFFSSHGYAPFNPAEFQLLEGTMKHLPRRRRERVIAFTSPFGEPCCMRTDITLSALAHISSHCTPEEFPLRLCYAERVFSVPRPPRQNLEEAQIGVELLGWESPGSDIEVISMLMRALDLLDLKNSLIVLGDASVISSLLDGIDDSLAARIVDQLQDGDHNGYAASIAESDLSSDRAKALDALPWLKGGIEVIDEAERVFSGMASVSRIRGICDALRRLGFADRIRIDLGSVRDLSYYTGPIFNVYASSAGTFLGGGGNYSAVLPDAGSICTAVGFGLNIRELAQARMLESVASPIVIWAGDEYAKAVSCADSLAQNGKPFVISWEPDMDRSRDGAKARGAKIWINVRDGWGADMESDARIDDISGLGVSK